MPTIHDYFQRAYQRRMEPFRGVSGERCVDTEGNSAQFWLCVEHGRIAQAQFLCTTCCTLLGLCEHAAELLTGGAIEQAEECSSRRLLMLHPEIPAMRHERAALVVRAIHSAAMRARLENNL